MSKAKGYIGHIPEKEYQDAYHKQVAKIEVFKDAATNETGLDFSWDVRFLEHMQANPSTGLDIVESIRRHADDLEGEFTSATKQA